MKTASRWLRRLFLLSGGCALGAFMCASAFAGPVMYPESAIASPHVAQDMVTQKLNKIYIKSLASGIPRPASFLIGGILTTESPILFIGRETTFSR
jgi:hypothetical protein